MHHAGRERFPLGDLLRTLRCSKSRCSAISQHRRVLRRFSRRAAILAAALPKRAAFSTPRVFAKGPTAAARMAAHRLGCGSAALQCYLPASSFLAKILPERPWKIVSG